MKQNIQMGTSTLKIFNWKQYPSPLGAEGNTASLVRVVCMRYDFQFPVKFVTVFLLIYRTMSMIDTAITGYLNEAFLTQNGQSKESQTGAKRALQQKVRISSWCLEESNRRTNEAIWGAELQKSKGRWMFLGLLLRWAGHMSKTFRLSIQEQNFCPREDCFVL